MMDQERTLRLRDALSEARLDAVVSSLPKNVLMLSGYWPVTGASIAIALADGSVELVVPEDEKDLTSDGWAVRVHTFSPASLDRITTASRAVIEPLRKAGDKLASGSRVGIEEGEQSEPFSYAAMHLYRNDLSLALADAFPGIIFARADEVFETLQATKTKYEIARLNTASAMAKQAFGAASRHLKPGVTEFQAAEEFRTQFKTSQPLFKNVQRAEVFFWAMSGANSALAYGAYARSRAKQIEEGDLVLVHCNTCADGYWTDITRTYSIGNTGDRKKEMYAAIFAARDAAFQAIHPGGKAAEVDRAARHVLDRAGFGKQFRHSTGHGVGFGAISPNSLPRIHPKSDDILEPGMVFNIEPAIYIEGFGGIRHCDMVAVTDAGFELLTDFQNRMDELFLTSAPASSAQSG